MKIIFTLLLFLIVMSAYVFVRAINMTNRRELKNEDCSAQGVHSVVHLNASKTVTDSINGAYETLDTLEIRDFDLDRFLSSLSGE